MKIDKIIKSGGLAAMTAALALTASSPAAARDDNNNNWHNNRPSGENRGDNRGPRPEQRGDNHAPAQVPNRGNGGPPSGPRVDPRAGQGQPQAQWREQQFQNRGGRPESAPSPNAGNNWNRGQSANNNWNRGPNGNWNNGRGYDRGPNNNVRPQQNPREQNGTYNGRQWRGDRNGTYYRNGQQWRGDNHQQWNRQWRNDNRYNWQNYRQYHRDIYRIGRYYSPYNGYAYRRLSIGFYLDNLFYADRYWISDPWYYRLPPAYGPYHWVRYYNDALLVNVYSGQVADVIYDFFW